MYGCVVRAGTGRTPTTTATAATAAGPVVVATTATTISMSCARPCVPSPTRSTSSAGRRAAHLGDRPLPTPSDLLTSHHGSLEACGFPGCLAAAFPSGPVRRLRPLCLRRSEPHTATGDLRAARPVLVHDLGIGIDRRPRPGRVGLARWRQRRGQRLPDRAGRYAITASQTDQGLRALRDPTVGDQDGGGD
jgi:hypothetical protein